MMPNNESLGRNSSVGSLELQIKRRLRRMSSISWTLWMIPSSLLLTLGLIDSDHSLVGSAIGVFFPFASLAWVSSVTFNQVFSMKYSKYPVKEFNNFTFFKLVKIVLGSFVCGMVLGVPCALGDWRSFTMGQQFLYWLCVVLVISLNYRNQLVGSIRSEGSRLTISNLLLPKRVPVIEIAAVEIRSIGKLLHSSQASFKMQDGMLVDIPRLRFYFQTPNELQGNAKTVSVLEYLSHMADTQTIYVTPVAH